MKWRALGWSAAVIGTALFIVLLWKGPWWADGAHLGPDLTPGTGAVVTGFRTAVVAVGAGIVAGVGLVYTHRNFRHNRDLFTHMQEKDREAAELTREGQMTDRYATAIELLGSPELTKQLGGIYALERVMRDSPKDHSTVVEVLAAYVRETARLPDDGTLRTTDDDAPRTQENVQAALTVLGRRPERKEPFHINLRRTDLRGLDLSYGRFGHANLSGSYLDEANLHDIHLEHADLTHAHLKRAYLLNAKLGWSDLSEAHLEGADLAQANIEGEATLYKVHLEGADLRSANLEYAKLHEAHLEGARLVKTRLRGAILHEADLRRADLYHAHLEETDLTGADMIPVDRLTIEQLLDAKSIAGAAVPDEFAHHPQLQPLLELEAEST